MPVRIADILLAWRRPLAAFLLATLVVATAYALFADEAYEAHARIQVVPVAADDETFEGFSVLRESDDEETPAETAADLVESSDVVDAVATRLTRDRDDLLDAVSADADGASNIVTVTAHWSSPQGAAQIANAFAEEFVARRSSQFQADLSRTIERLRDVPGAEARVGTLATYEGLPDPTVEVVGDAVASESSVSPSPFVIVVGAMAGAVLLALAAAAVVAARSPRAQTVAVQQGAGDDTDTKLAAREREAASRQHELEERERSARREAADARQPALDEHKATLDEPRRERRVAVSVVEAPVPGAPRPPAESAEGPLMLPRLERLVREHGDEHPDRIDEWRAYLFHLRDHATPEGALSPALEALALEVFADLLDAREP